MVHRSVSRPLAAVSVLALAAASLTGSLAASSASAGAAPQTHVRAGRMTPATGVDPHYRRVGSAAKADAQFTCQTTDPVTCFGPDQIRHAYGIDALLRRGVTGRGRTIVIIDAFSSPTIRHDLATFDRLFGLPAAKLRIIAPQGLTPFDQSDPGQVSWASEITLDVEWAHAVAPRARIDLVLARTNEDADLFAATRYVARRHLGDVVSQSFGEAEQCSAVSLWAQHRVFRQLVSHGTTVLSSTGDQGAAEPSCDGSTWVKAASTPASDPLVTAVGGTNLSADGPSGAYESETVWNEPDFAAAGGSGFSTVFPEPAYQRTVQHSGRRAIPDVAYHAGIDDGVLVVWSTSGEGPDLLFLIGGTSAGSPQWAGLVALAAQMARHRLGDINPALYRLGSSRAYSTLFHDVTSGNTTVTEQDASGNDVTVQGSSAHRGWDPATGFGSPKANRLVPALARSAR